MKHKFNDTRSQLIISADANEREELQKMPADVISSDRAMHEVFEPLISNSELQWGGAWATGDLTEAPMIWITGQDVTMHKIPKEAIGTVFTGSYGNPPELHYAPILERWAFMGYETKSVLEDLRDKGEVIFIGGKL